MSYSAYISMADQHRSNALPVCAATALSAPSGPRRQQGLLQVAILQSPQQFVKILSGAARPTVQEAAQQLQQISTNELPGKRCTTV